jgi:hypothetical protein
MTKIKSKKGQTKRFSNIFEILQNIDKISDLKENR